MNEKLDEKVYSFFQKSLPLLTSVVFMLLGYTPLNLVFFNNVRPDMGLICIYFWVLHRPDLFGLLSIIVLSVVEISVSSTLLGADFFAYLVMYTLIYNVGKYFNSKPFVVIWYGFMAFSLASLLLKWLIVSFYYSKFLPISVLIFEYLIAVALYPVVSMILAFVQNKFIGDDER